MRKGGFALRQRVTILTACRPGAAGCSETMQAHRSDSFFSFFYTKCCFTQLKPARCGQGRTAPHTGDVETHMREAAFQRLVFRRKMFKCNNLFLLKVPTIPHRNLSLNPTPSDLIQATCLHRSHTECVLSDIKAANVLENVGYEHQRVGRGVNMMVWPHSNSHELTVCLQSSIRIMKVPSNSCDFTEKSTVCACDNSLSQLP